MEESSITEYVEVSEFEEAWGSWESLLEDKKLPDVFEEAWEIACEEEGMNIVPPVVDEEQDLTFPFLLEPSCLEKYKLGSPISQEGPDVTRASEVVVHVQYDDTFSAKPVSLQMIGPLIYTPLACALIRVVQEFNSIHTLNLTRCFLRSEAMMIISYLVRNSGHLKTLILDHNPVRDQTHGLVLAKGNGLEHLSLSHCNINHRGAERLAEGIRPSSLKTLDLSCNNINDEGAEKLAKGIRLNASLVHVNLSGNTITDRGAEALSKIFQEFNLNMEEKAARLQRMEYDFFESFKKKEEPGGWNADHSSIPKNSKTIIPSNISAMKKKKVTVPDPEGQKKPSIPEKKRLDIIIDAILSQDSHHLIAQTKECNDGTVRYRGNCTLMSLDLSYNFITKEGVLIFLEAIDYQDSKLMRSSGKGITVLNFEGNKLDPEGSSIAKVMERLNKFPGTREEKSKPSKSAKIGRKGGFHSPALTSKRNTKSHTRGAIPQRKSRANKSTD